jgi:3-phenylpropionate/trans-cinnamate dioxygenase ferredoxin reductase subunit
MSDPPTRQTVVIVGAGQAGGEIAIELRKLGFAGRVLIVGEEPFPPYKRPPLSKAYFAGTVSEESLHLMPRSGLDKAGIEWLGGARVARIDREARQLELSDGRRLDYHRLALATGGRARPLALPGADLPNVFPLRTIGDVRKISAQRAAGKRLVIVGGGFIGLEVAAVAIKLGLRVTVLEGLPRVLARVTIPEVSAFFERVHREAGVDLRTGVQVQGFERASAATRVRFADGQSIEGAIEADFVVYGIGMIPNTELAQEAGLAVDNGIVVDECTRTSDPHIVAAGDCANHPNDFAGRRIRLESVQNAMEQAKAAALTLMDQPKPYQAVPWFWSDQYDLKLQMAGLSAGHDRYLFRGDPATQRAFAVFYLNGGRLIAADTVNRPQDYMLAKKLISLKAAPDPSQLADAAVPLKSLLPAA